MGCTTHCRRLVRLSIPAWSWLSGSSRHERRSFHCYGQLLLHCLRSKSNTIALSCLSSANSMGRWHLPCSCFPSSFSWAVSLASAATLTRDAEEALRILFWLLRCIQCALRAKSVRAHSTSALIPELGDTHVCFFKQVMSPVLWEFRLSFLWTECVREYLYAKPAHIFFERYPRHTLQ